MEIQRRLTEGKTFTIHRGYDRSPGAVGKRQVVTLYHQCSGAVQEELDILILNHLKADLFIEC